MEIIQDFMTVADIIPADKTVSVLTINYKKIGGIHAGHNYILNMAKNKADILLVNFCEQQGSNVWFDLPYNYSGFDEEYCMDWCRKNKVDYVLIFSCNSITDCKAKYDLTSIKSQADSIFNAENYGRFNLTDNWIYAIKFVIGSHLLMQQQNKLYNQQYRIRSWNDGIYPFIVRDYFKKYYKDLDIIAPLRDENDLIISTTLLNKPAELKDGLAFIKNQFEGEFLKGNNNIKNLKIGINAKLKESGFNMYLTSLKYYNETITNNKPLVTFAAHNHTEGLTYFMSEYYDYI